MLAGSVVGAEHAATVSASTKPITIFFIIYPFSVLHLISTPIIHCLFKFTTIKSAAPATLSYSSCEQQCCSVHHYNFCEVGSGVTIVSTGSVVGAEHAATVRASTKPTTTFFIVCPFIAEMIDVVLYAKERHRSTALSYHVLIK